MADSLRFKQMLIQLGRLLRPEEFNILKFVCSKEIPTKQREKIISSEILFEILEERGKLSEHNLVFLKSILQTALEGRTDVLQVIEEYERQMGPVSPDADGARSPLHQSLGFDKEIEYLEDNLGKEYKYFLRRLGVYDHQIDRVELSYPKSIKEVIHQCMRIWLNANKNRQHSELLSVVIGALKKEKRNDLAKTIEEGTFC